MTPDGPSNHRVNRRSAYAIFDGQRSDLATILANLSDTRDVGLSEFRHVMRRAKSMVSGIAYGCPPFLNHVGNVVIPRPQPEMTKATTDYAVDFVDSLIPVIPATRRIIASMERPPTLRDWVPQSLLKSIAVSRDYALPWPKLDGPVAARGGSEMGPTIGRSIPAVDLGPEALGQWTYVRLQGAGVRAVFAASLTNVECSYPKRHATVKANMRNTEGMRGILIKHWEAPLSGVSGWGCSSTRHPCIIPS